MKFLAALILLAPQDPPYTAAELAALRSSVDELVRAGKMVPAAAKFRELKAERIPPEELPKLQELDRKVGGFAALLLETSTGGVGEVPKLSRIVVKGGGKPLGRVFRQDALFVHYETVTGIRSRIAKAQVEAVTALSPAESAAEVQAEFMRQAGNRGLVSTSDPGKPPAWKEVGAKKASGAQLFAVADFAAKNGLGEPLAALFELAMARDPKLRETAHVAKGERLVNQLLFSITVNQLPQAEHSLATLAARYRDTAAYRERVHGDKELGELVGVLLKKELLPPAAPEEPRVLAAAPPPPPADDPLAAATAPPVDVPPPAAPPPDPDPVDRTVPVTSRKLPPTTAPDLLAMVAKGDAMFDQGMKHLLASDPNENPDGWTRENAKALELFTKANQESYLPVQERFDAPVPQPLLNRVRETTLRSSLCRKRSVSKYGIAESEGRSRGIPRSSGFPGGSASWHRDCCPFSMEAKRLKILAAVADDPPSQTYLPILVAIEDLRKLELTILRVSPPGADREAERASLEQARRVFSKAGFAPRVRHGSGDPAVEISACARAGRTDAVVVATHARRGLRRALLGSVTEELIRRCPVPVLAFRPGGNRGRWRHAAVALDGTKEAERSLDAASRFALACGTPLQLLRVGGDDGYLETVADRLERDGVAAAPYVLRGTPANGLLSHLRRLDVDLLCMTTHGRSGLSRLLSGSVAERVLRRAPCPVLIRRA